MNFKVLNKGSPDESDLVDIGDASTYAMMTSVKLTMFMSMMLMMLFFVCVDDDIDTKSMSVKTMKIIRLKA